MKIYEGVLEHRIQETLSISEEQLDFMKANNRPNICTEATAKLKWGQKEHAQCIHWPIIHCVWQGTNITWPIEEPYWYMRSKPVPEKYIIGLDW